MVRLQDAWEFNVLGIYNYRLPGRLQALFEFLGTHHAVMPGDIVEAGVYKGSSLLAIALYLKELGSEKKVYGFDSFAGFPPVHHPNDDVVRFDDLLEEARITRDHYDAVQRNREWVESLRRFRARPSPTGDLSSSGQFADTSLELIRHKIDLLGLDNVVLVDGPFHETMPRAQYPSEVMAVVMDCDLYESYLEGFRFVWPRLVHGGFVHLDEYYSLKFPGARIATDEFLKRCAGRLEMRQTTGEFERWHLIKEA